LMNRGRIEQIGTPEELYATPATTFVAKFIGTPPMSLLPAVDVVSNAPGLAPHFPGGRAPASLILGVRPENLHVAEHAAPEHLAVRVRSVEYLGADSYIEANVNGASLLVRTPGRTHFGPDSQISMSLDKAHLHWFDAATGRRIAAHETTQEDLKTGRFFT
jgi:sn-glycerol 3-phosphate transport system ATP-binding protein